MHDFHFGADVAPSAEVVHLFQLHADLLEIEVAAARTGDSRVVECIARSLLT